MKASWIDFSPIFKTPKKEEKYTNQNNKLQKVNIDPSDLCNFKFTKTIYKTIDEILSQTNKTNCEKLEEWYEIEKEHKWLIDIKFDAWIWLAQVRSKPWYNKTI